MVSGSSPGAGGRVGEGCWVHDIGGRDSDVYGDCLGGRGGKFRLDQARRQA